MSVENAVDRQLSADHSGCSRKNKKTILKDKKFMIDILDKIISSKVLKLINSYGGKVLLSLDKNTDYLISDKTKKKQAQNNKASESIDSKVDGITINVSPCSKNKNPVDLIQKANHLNIQILSAKQFQHWLKSLLKKRHGDKKSKDKVASVLRGKVSLKIESLDQGQCPVFEFIPKWPDLGDALCKKKPKVPDSHNFSSNEKSGDVYSSEQYSTSEIGGMCELCDIPFMNYKEHINTKKHLKESQDENRFHELDSLINERPIEVIFKQFSPERKISENPNTTIESPSVQNCLENTIISIIDSDSDECKQKTMHYSFGDKNPNTIVDHPSSSLKNKCSDTHFKFVPQKRPSNLHSPLHKEINYHKKTKRKNKMNQKLSSKDIYKVEVVNSPRSSSINSSNDSVDSEKPPVIVRFKRIQPTIAKHYSSDPDGQISSNVNNKHFPEDPIPVRRYFRVVRKPSFSNEVQIAPKGYSENLIYSFEYPELHQNVGDVLYYPTYNHIPNSGSSIGNIQEKIAKIDNYSFKCPLSFENSLKFMSNMVPQQIGKWFYNIKKKNHT